MPVQKELSAELTNRIAEYGEAVKEVCKLYGLPMSKIVIIARDPNDDAMYTCITDEDNEGLKKACELALQQPALVVEGTAFTRDVCKGCGADFAEFPEMRHSEEECPGPECSCYEVTGGHQMGCAFYGVNR